MAYLIPTRPNRFPRRRVNKDQWEQKEHDSFINRYPLAVNENGQDRHVWMGDEWLDIFINLYKVTKDLQAYQLALKITTKHYWKLEMILVIDEYRLQRADQGWELKSTLFPTVLFITIILYIDCAI